MNKVILLVALAAITSASHAKPWSSEDRARMQHCYQTADHACVVREHRKYEARKVQDAGGMPVAWTLRLHAKTDLSIRNGE